MPDVPYGVATDSRLVTRNALAFRKDVRPEWQLFNGCQMGWPWTSSGQIAEHRNSAKGHWRIQRRRNCQFWGLLSRPDDALQSLSRARIGDFARETAKPREFLSVRMILMTVWRRERDANRRFLLILNKLFESRDAQNCQYETSAILEYATGTGAFVTRHSVLRF
jgi:hypothetical protein